MRIKSESKLSTSDYLIRMFLFVILFVLVMWSFSSSSNGGVNAVNGVLDLSDYSVSNDGGMMLGGEWSFYWDQLLKTPETTQPDKYVKAPSTWNRYSINGEKLPAYGYATYSLRVTGVAETELAMRIPPFATAYELYVDGVLKSKNGVVGSSEESSRPEYSPQIVWFPVQSGEFLITVCISNYSYARGGMWYPIMLGTRSQIWSADRLVLYLNLFLIGSFVTMAIFCLLIFFMARKETALILFALLALVTAVRTTVYGPYLLSSCGVDFRTLVVVEHLTLVWMPVLVGLFLLSFLPREDFRVYAAFICFGAVLISLFILTTPVSEFTKDTVFIGSYGMILALFALINFFMIRNNMIGAILFGAVALMTGGVYDVFFHSCLFLGIVELSPVGFFIMLNTWGVVLAKYYTSMSQYAKYSVNKARKAEFAYLQAQIKPHFLYNALNVISTLCKIDGEYAEKLTIELSKYLHYTFEFKNLSQYISFSQELDFIATYVKIEKARFVNEFDVVYDLCDTSELVVPPLSIQPLVENAIRHGIREKGEYGLVILKVHKTVGAYIIEIIDDGVGISQEKLEQLRLGRIGKSDGVGINNVKSRIESLKNAKFEIQSKLGAGTIITIAIPDDLCLNGNKTQPDRF